MMAITDPIELDDLTPSSFAGRPVTVLGLARSGIALARYLHDQGARVTVYDGRPEPELAEAIEALGDRDVSLRLGPAVDPATVLAGQSLVATSPSINSRYPTTEPRLRAALGELEARGRVPVVSEVDLFLRLCPAITIGVTGTKGKTTTSSLIAAVLAQGSHPVLLGGNIGTPLVERLPELTTHHRVLVELSELQLPTLSRGTDVSVYTHVTSDHLDRHGSLDAYRDVKRRLAELAPPTGALVLNDEDPVTRGWDEGSAARVVRYRRIVPPMGGIGVEDGWVTADVVEPLTADNVPGLDGPILSLDDIPLPGWHSVSNVAAAVAVGALFGLSAESIRAGVTGFAGVEHRLEPVATIDGVRFVNDSQGTQPDAVIAAVRSFAPPVVLICGGRSKGIPMDDLATVVAERVTAAVLIGESGPELGAAFQAAGLDHTERATSMDQAVRTADRIARAARESRSSRAGAEPADGEPATVLLSPAAASFDMYPDYAARGRDFKRAVADLIADRSPGGDR
jgi:UDP-N-acetylmuramoylalanine--D-glutamate ligase